MVRRVALFILTNLAVLVVLHIVVGLFGLAPAFGRAGLDLKALTVFALIWGMGGALISLALSKPMALWSTGAQVITRPRSAAEAWLVETVARQAQAAGIGVPDVAVYDSPDPNAFATGARRDHALVAVSTGLLEVMDRDEVEAVLAHEVSHIANGDMVTMALLQGVLNAFVIALARVVGALVDGALQGERERRGPGIGYWLVTLVCELLFGLLASVIVMAFSRAREFRADAGGAALAGRGRMIAALEALRRISGPAALPGGLQAFGVRGGAVAKLLSSHPPLEARIAALRQG